MGGENIGILFVLFDKIEMFLFGFKCYVREEFNMMRFYFVFCFVIVMIVVLIFLGCGYSGMFYGSFYVVVDLVNGLVFDVV